MIYHFLDNMDQFDALNGAPDERNSMQKLGERLADRQEALKTASNDDFAVVIYDGHQHRRKFPVQTADDVKMSKVALEASADRLPDEIVKTAQHYIDLAARELLGEPAYDEPPDEQLTNVVYTGHISRRDYEDKTAELDKTAGTDLYLIDDGETRQYPLHSARHVKQAERLVRHGLGVASEDEYAACQRLIKRANELEVELEAPQVLRYDRDTIPAGFRETLNVRAKLAADDVAEWYDKLADEATDMGPLRTAKALHILDQVAGFAPMEGEKLANSRLGKHAPSAFEAVFPTTEPQASSQSVDKVASVFGDEFAQTYAEDRKAAMSELTGVERKMLERAEADK